MMKNFKYIILTIIIGISAFSCNDSYLEENPPHILVADNLYVDLAGFQAGLNAIYANVRTERYMLGEPSELSIVYALCGTDIITGVKWYDKLNVFGEVINPQYITIPALWSWLYSIVNASNTIIERAEYPDVDLMPGEKNRIIGEARFFRAWAYRHLSFLYGPVPLNLEEARGSNIKTDWVRTPVNEIREQIIDDLEFASENLSETPDAEASNITTWVARHFLAEMYLTTGDNVKAEQVAQDVVDNNPFALVTGRYGVTANQPGTPFTDMFMTGNINRYEGNTEVMWSLQYEYQTIGGGANWNRRNFLNRYRSLSLGHTVERGGRGQGYMGPTSYMLSLYEPEDDRGSEFAWRKYYVLSQEAGDKLSDGMQYGDTLWLDTTEDKLVFGNIRWCSPRKFDDALEIDPTISNGFNDYSYLRLAATNLLLAEAKFKNGDLSGAAAAINVLRNRANASQVSAADINLEFILEESARELWGEDLRKYTLLRNNVWLERTNQYNKLVEGRATEKFKRLPIPQVVIDANIDLEMEQNPGY